MTYTAKDREYIEPAIKEAGDDPRQFKVGAVIVTRNNEVVSAHGGEDSNGKEHAEFRAIHKCLEQSYELEGATLYTTLEPCVEHARSPGDTPCAVEILTHRIDRVVIGIIDTDSRVRKRGVHKLRQGGVVVDECPDQDLRTEIKKLMAPFLKQERPPFRENYPFPLAGIFVGRVAERKLLSEWLCLKGNYGRLPILVLHGIGGAGKSSLAWLWANRDVAGIELPLPDDPKEVAKQCAIDRGWRIGLSVLWFSFYREEGGETFPRFLETAIEHFSGGRRLPSNYLVDGKKDYYEMERDLRDILNTQKCLLIWDGAERLLWEYFDSDAVLKDSLRPVPQEYTVRSRNFVNPQVARFVWGFTRQIHSKLLILSRVSIADLENYPAEQIPLKGLEPEAAVEFLKKRGVRGPESLLRKRAEDYAFHPLSLSNLAAAVIEDYNTFGHIGDAPSFDPGIPMNRRRRHVLKVAFQKRSSQLRQLLSRLAAARGVIRGEVFEHLSEDIKGLDKSNIGRSLGELLRHGLLRRWDANNAFDMHPLVRGYAYVRLSGKQKIHQKLSDYYRLSRQTLKLDDPIDIGWVESAIEFFYHTARAGRYMDALYFFKTDYDKRARNLNSVLFDELGDYFDFIGLLTELFPDGLDSQPAVDEWWKAMVLNDLALAYLNIGDPQRAERLLKRGVNFARELRRRYGSHPQDLLGASRQIALCLESLAEARSSLGKLRKAFENIMDSAALCLVFDLDQGVIFVARVPGSLFSLLGRHQEFESLIGPVRNTVSVENPTEYFYDLAFAEDFLMRGDTPSAALHLKTAKQRLQGLTDRNPFPRFRVQLECSEGEIALASGELQPAEGHFSSALRDGRRLGLVELELRALLGLAGVNLSRTLDPKETEPEPFRREAYDLALQALDYAERSGFVLVQADAHNFLAKLALSKGDGEDANKHASIAKRLSSCGLKRPKRNSFYYARGYREAMHYLRAPKC